MLIRLITDWQNSPFVRAVDAAAVATGAIVFVPVWRDTLHEISGVAADIAPIAAVLWLVVQIICKIFVTIYRLATGYED